MVLTGATNDVSDEPLLRLLPWPGPSPPKRSDCTEKSTVWVMWLVRPFMLSSSSSLPPRSCVPPCTHVLFADRSGLSVLDLFREDEWLKEDKAMSPSPIMVLDTPAAQSVMKRRMEGRHAVMRDVPAAIEVQSETTADLKGRSSVGAS